MNELPQDLKKQFQAYNQMQLNSAFTDACAEGCLAVVKYLLTSSDLTVHAEIHAMDDWGFRWACSNGHLDIVRYLLISPDLTEHTNIHVNNDDGFINACLYQHMNIVDYLLTSPELQEHANIHAENDAGFRLTCESQNINNILYFLSLTGKQYINFQQTKYDLHWAMENKFHDIVWIMLNNLYVHHRKTFDEFIYPVMDYYIKESIEHYFLLRKKYSIEPAINSSVPELFL